jgi:hypothetical protein
MDNQRERGRIKGCRHIINNEYNRTLGPNAICAIHENKHNHGYSKNQTDAKKDQYKTANVLVAYKKHECCATELERIIDLYGIYVPRYVIHKIFEGKGLASELPNKNKRHK